LSKSRCRDGRDLGALVVASAPQPRSVQRYRHDQIRSPPQLDYQPGDLDAAPLRPGMFALVLQAVNRLSDDIVKQIRAAAVIE
jgi:hypothetical protein